MFDPSSSRTTATEAWRRFLQARALCSLAIVCMFPVLGARAQIGTVTGTTSTPTAGVGHDYYKMLNETVDPATGALSVRIGIPTPPARGLTLPFAFSYDSNSYTLKQVQPGLATWTTNQGLFVVGAWSNTLPQLTTSLQEYLIPNTNSYCYSSVGYLFQDSSGARHPLGLSAVLTNPNSYPACSHTGWTNFLTGGDDFVQATLTGAQGNLNGNQGAGVGTVQIADASGTVYTFGPNWNCNPGVSFSGPQIVQPLAYSMPSSIEDRNGNTISFSSLSQHCGGSTFSLTDTTGRTALSFTTNGANRGQQINSVTVSGLTNPYTATWATTTPQPINLHATEWAGTSTNCNSLPSWSPYGSNQITAITLPNGKQYQFSYDPAYALISKITFPSGGYISYTWGLNPQSADVAFADKFGALKQCGFNYDTPAILHRYVSYDGSTIALQQDFAYSTTWANGNWSSKQTIVTTHDLVRNTSFVVTYTYTSGYLPTIPNAAIASSPFGAVTAPQVPTESSIVYQSISGATLKTVNKSWVQFDPFKLGCEATTLDNGQISSVTYSYGPGHIITDKREYDFGAPSCGGTSTPTRESSTTYQSFSNTPIYPGAPSILDRPQTTYIYGAGALIAQTNYSYDQISTGPVANLPTGTHDEINYSATSAAPRGNATSVTRKCLQTCADSITTYTFDETGQMLTLQDPCGSTSCNDMTGTNHTTTFSYADNYDSPPTSNTDTYLTNVTDHLGHTVVYKYAFTDGQLIATTDQNSLVTSYLYADPLRRITETDHPDGGSTVLTYNDAAPTPSVTTAMKINTTTTETSVVIKDGVGHTIHSQLTSDPQGTVYTDTTYDGLGLVYTVSNPYRLGSDPTSSPGTTTYVYDTLGRKLTQTYPDNSVLTTAYCGPNILVTDPSKRWRRSRSDAFGRLVEVDEPNAVGATVNSNACPGTGEPIWITSYTLNALNDLTNVVQNGSRQRSFAYDSLARLLTSTNPEVETITYTYDVNGNVQTKKDARAIITTYGYDVLNRELTRTYSNLDPTVTTAYDQPTCLGLSSCQNIGHRTSMTDAAGSESWAYQVDKTNSRSVHVDQRTTNSLTKTSTYYLDLVGNVTQAIYPTGRTVNYTYDAADRPSTTTDSSNGITYATGFQSSPGTGCLPNVTCYTPQGSIYAVSLGQTSTFTGLNITNSYTSRLQPQEFKASSTGGSAIDLTYSFLDPLNNNKNSGHVFSITNNLNTARTQSFTYDQVNRITSAGTFATTGPYCWGYQYAYDSTTPINAAWGNLTSQAGWTPNYNGCTQTVMAAVTADGNNHISAFSYDAAGNATGETGFTYVWDAESQLKSAGGVNYAYDGDGRRVAKVGSKLYWYGSGSEILAETDAAGNTQNEYVFFGGKRVALLPAGGTAQYYVEDSLGSSRVITSNTGVVCYDGDFYPFGGERAVTSTCTQNNYKFEGKERDAETSTLPGNANGNDEFGARYYSNRFGRWLSADWSNVPVPVPYANLANPQTLNLYSMVADDPESFADLDGHGVDPTTFNCLGGGSIDPCVGGMFGLHEHEPDPDSPFHHGQTPKFNPCETTGHGCYIADGADGGDGHHLITLWKALKGTPVYPLVRALKTGPLADKATNYYNGLHRLYNGAVAEIRASMEKELGKPLGEFSRRELTELSKRILNSADSRISNFLESLGKTAAGQSARHALGTAISIIEGLSEGIIEMTPILCVSCGPRGPMA